MILFLVILLLYFALEFFTLRGVKNLFANGNKTKYVSRIYYGQLLISIGCLVVSMLLFMKNRGQFSPFSYFLASNSGAVFFVLMVMKLFFVIFYLLNIVYYAIKKLISRRGDKTIVVSDESRRNFLTKTGVIVSAIPFFTISHGILFGKYNFRVLKERISSPKLSSVFNGFRIVQISDIHIGSFYNSRSEVQEGVDLINSLQPDLVVFTGDLVNNFGSEIVGYEDVLGSIQAKYGKYAVLGNHDYGDYVPWSSVEEKEANFVQVLKAFEAIGFKLIRNSTVQISKQGESFNLIGVENWGKPPFPQYGDLKKALLSAEEDLFSVLLSHDPSHWDAEVLRKTSIELTLSGHTHGMQFGVETGNYQWSPVKLRYPRWGGLYPEGNQFLYVNRGFGFIGFPGRIGMPPEITLIELESA
jgi:uncharacterized protein